MGWSTLVIGLLQQKGFKNLGSETDTLDGVDTQPGEDFGCSKLVVNIDRSVSVAAFIADLYQSFQISYGPVWYRHICVLQFHELKG